MAGPPGFEPGTSGSPPTRVVKSPSLNILGYHPNILFLAELRALTITAVSCYYLKLVIKGKFYVKLRILGKLLREDGMLLHRWER